MSDASVNSRAARQVDDLSFYGRLRFTPISDAIRGELSARLSVAYVIDAADLPPPLPHTIMKLVRRTRLWRGERLEVARELIAHFQDGLSAGAAPDQLVRDFGDIDRAARLIRRAKKRHRSLWWKSAVRSIQAVVLLPLIVLLLYVPIAIRFFMGVPSVTHDYLADLNTNALAVPVDQRAWPVYRDALKGLQSPTELVPDTDPTTAPHPAGVKPGDEHWPVYEQYIRDNADRLALIRKAAAMPGLGFVAATNPSPEDAELYPTSTDARASANLPVLYSVLLPYLSEMRKLAFLLVIDARRAASAGDSQRVLDNIAALLGIAKQTRENPVLVGDLVSLAIVQLTLDRIGEVIAEQPHLFSDDQLRELAHRIAALTDEVVCVRISSERANFYDFVQHAYTDDGNGDGRFTASGLNLFDFVSDVTHLSKQSDPIRTTMTPLIGSVIMNRRQLVAEFDGILDAMEANAARPLWKREHSPVDAVFQSWEAEPLGKIRRLPLAILVPAIDKATLRPHYVRSSRDAVLAAIALELYQRRHGQWPSSLDELVTSLLPAVPIDPYDGQALRYRIVHGSPVLYSIGNDREDDGGVPRQRKQGGVFDDNEARKWWSNEDLTRLQAVQGGPFLDGDWILWKGQPRLEN